LVVGAVGFAMLGPGLPGGPHVPPGDGPPPQRGEDSSESARPPEPSEQALRVCDRMAAPWGSNEASGEPRDPFRTPRRLATSLRPGQTGCLRVGTYRQTEVLVKRRAITLRSSPGERALWRGRVVLLGPRERLVDLTLDGSYGPRDCGDCGTLPSPTINAPDAVVADSDISNPGSGICVHPREWGGRMPNRFRIERNRIHDCGRRPATEHDHGIYVADGRDGAIRDNVIFNNADRGIQLYPDARGTTVANNTVDGNGSGIVFSRRSARNTVRDNVFSNAVRRWNAESFNLTGRGNSFLGNCVRPGNPNDEYNENGGVALPRLVWQARNYSTRDPVYRDRARGDFRIPPESACAQDGARDSVAAPRG
jgi:parallel beta-helix repeat protein